MNKLIKKIVLIIVLISILVVTVIASAGGSMASALGFVDSPSLMIVILPTIFMLAFADLMGDYARAVRFMFGEKAYTTKEIKTSISAVDLSVKLVISTGVLGTLIGLIMNFSNLGSNEVNNQIFLINIALNIMPLFYAVILNLIQLPIKYSLQKEITYRED